MGRDHNVAIFGIVCIFLLIGFGSFLIGGSLFIYSKQKEVCEDMEITPSQSKSR